jgi:hypothetical protein
LQDPDKKIVKNETKITINLDCTKITLAESLDVYFLEENVWDCPPKSPNRKCTLVAMSQKKDIREFLPLTEFSLETSCVNKSSSFFETRRIFARKI